MDVQVKRVYEAPEESDGFRILTDRLWPRGISKEKAALGIWDKSIAPSTELRKWFGHDPEKFEKFKKIYAEELYDYQKDPLETINVVTDKEYLKIKEKLKDMMMDFFSKQMDK